VVCRGFLGISAVIVPRTLGVPARRVNWAGG
jgi:hypothetical protein